MATQLIDPTDAIEVLNLPVLIYGPPGCGKTSLCQTAADTLTLDFDRGIHRSFNRKKAMRFDSWSDCLREQQAGSFRPFRTLVLDTLGALLDAVAREVMAESAKNTQGGGLTIQGWGVLGNRFGQWLRLTVAAGQDVVMVCHEEEEKDVNGNRYLRPAMPGKMAYSTVHRLVDLMAHVRYDGKQRWLDFSPTDLAVGKNAAGFDPVEVGRLEQTPALLGGLLAEAKRRIGHTAEASALVAREVKDWQEWAEAEPDLAAVNETLSAASGKLAGAARKQVWAVVSAYAERKGWEFDREAKAYREKEAVA